MTIDSVTVVRAIDEYFRPHIDRIVKDHTIAMDQAVEQIKQLQTDWRLIYEENVKLWNYIKTRILEDA